jgi:bacterioferritin-associated ferredoxin
MIVCICHRVSDRDIEREARAGCASFEELQSELGVATGCGQCSDCARETFARVQACSSHRRVIPIAAAGMSPPLAA